MSIHTVNGRIWFMWRSDVASFTLLHKSDQLIHTEVQLANGGPRFLFTAVYALNDAPLREPLWVDIQRISASVDMPWLVAGDFNTMLVRGEKLNDGEPVSFDNSELLHCTTFCNLQDMKFTGIFHTWCNNREGDQRTYCKLDRTLVNEIWLQVFPNVETLFENNGVSYHSCAIVSVCPSLKMKKAFKICDIWTKHPQFFEIVEQAWQVRVTGAPMFILVKKLQTVKMQLKKLHIDNFSDLKTKISVAKQQLETCQSAILGDLRNVHLHAQEKQLKEQYFTLLIAESNLAKQQAKVSWLTQGDRNTAFYHAKIKQRRAMN